MKLGDYEVLEELGRGGMGVVLRARSPRGEDVAVKLLSRRDPETLARFDRERRLLGEFTARDGFVPLLDAGTSPHGPYLVMPFVPGGTLRARLDQGPLGVGKTLELGRALADALGRAHERGVVHRDLKPENVLFAADGRPLVADLGLAKHFTSDAPGARQTVSLSIRGAFRGTAGYMPAEQMDDATTVGPAADVFALGAILYECLTGFPAFAGESVVAVVSKVSDGSLEPVRRARPEVPAWLASVVERCLAREADDRYGDALVLRRALEPRRAAARPVAAVVAAVGVTVVAAVGLGRSRGDAVTAPVLPSAPVPVAPGAGLPEGLRLAGRCVPAADGKEAALYLYRLPDGSDVEMVAVVAGQFVMGSEEGDAFEAEKPRHVHRVERTYWIGRTEVTWGQYRAFCKATGRKEPERPWFADGCADWLVGLEAKHPVVNVSWEDATAYCGWAGLRLPSEAEWELAARGVDGRKYPWGGEWLPGGQCNYADRSCPMDGFTLRGKNASESIASFGGWDRDNSDGHGFTAPVGSYPGGASPCGAVDMAGNVWEWCEDSYDEKGYERYGRGDFAPPGGGSHRLYRGGSWRDSARLVRASIRNASAPGSLRSVLGFRVSLRSAP